MAFTPPSPDDVIDSGFKPPAVDDIIPEPSAADKVSNAAETAGSSLINRAAGYLGRLDPTTARLFPGLSKTQPGVSLIPEPTLEAGRNRVTSAVDAVLGRQTQEQAGTEREMTALQDLGLNPDRSAVEDLMRAQPASPIAQAAGNVAKKAVQSTTTPGAALTLPFFELAPGRAVMAAYGLSHTPEEISNVKNVFKDPNSTKEQKWEALGDAGLNLAMNAGLLLSLKPDAVKSQISPEQAADILDQHENLKPKESNAQGIRGNQGQSGTTGEVREGSEANRGGDLQQASPKPPEPVAQGAQVPPQSPVGPAPETPLTEKYPGVFENIPPKNVPIEIKRANGTIEPALFNGYYNLESIGRGQVPSVGRMTEYGWTRGLLSPGDEILTEIPKPEAPSHPGTEPATVEQIEAAAIPQVEKPIIDQAVKKGGRQKVQYPPNPILDFVNDEMGSIRLKSKAKPGTEAHYEGEAYHRIVKSGHVKFSETGSTPDQVVTALERAGLVNPDFTSDDLWQALDRGVSERQNISKGNTPEQKQEKFYKLLEKGGKSNRTYVVSVGDMQVGHKFSIKGEDFEITHIDPDTGEVTVKDGTKFGYQTIPDGADIPVDKGSLEAPKVETVANDPFALEPSESVEEQKARELKESADKEARDKQLVAETAKATKERQARERLASRIGGDLGSAGEGKLFAEPGQQEIFQPKPPGMTGMGGAVPSEFENNPNTATSIKNATVDAERAKRGLPPAMQPARRSFGEVWDRAMAMVDRDGPALTDRLLDELREKPRALTDVEDALLLHRQIDLQNDYGKATRDIAQAYEDGDAGRQEEARIRTARISDQLLDLYNIGKKVGTETGRGLNARKMMAYEDFTLANMELEKRAANNGRPLTNEERAQITALHEQINQLQKAYDEHRAKTDDRIRQLETDKALAEAKAQATKETIHPKIIEAARKIVGKLDERADAARKRLKEKFARTSAGVDPTILADLADIGASHLGHGIVDFAEWSVKVAQDLGDLADRFKDNMQEIFAAANKKFNAATAENPLELARAMRQRPPEEQIEANADKIVEKVKKGKKDEITWHVQRIARLLVQSGVKDREVLIDRIHAILQKAIPDITRRETMDAISGYGNFKQLSKDDISVQLRGMKGEMQQLAKLEDMVKGQPPLKSGVERRTPTEAERQLVKRVNEAKFKFQVPMSDPATQLKSALDTLKTTLRNRIADYEDRIARGDYAKRPKRELVLDREAMRLKAEAERVKKQFQEGLLRDRLKQRTPWEKTMDTLAKWRRGFILSGPVTLAKLTTAAIARAITTPAEELAGLGLKQIPGVSKISKMAPREGGASLKAEVRSLVKGLSEGAKDSWQTLKTGHSELERVYGKRLSTPQSFIDVFGNIHGALKSTTKRAEWERSMEKRAQYYASQGVDVSDPVIQTRIGIEAYQDAEKSIFLQRNWLADKVNAFVKARTDKTGHAPPGQKAFETVGRVLLPIVRVPTNIVAETMQYAFGSVTGSIKAAKALAKGIETLKPEDADLIMRHLKKGSLGAAVMLTGFLNPDAFGGYYQQGEHRNKKDVPPDSVRVFGVTVPSYLTHFPLMGVAQLGATVRRVADSKLRKSDREPQGLGAGAMAGAVGLADSTPFIRETTEIAKLMNPRERSQWLGEMAKSLVVPQFVQSIANATDKDAQGNPIKRKPETIPQAIETGIPGLRQNVPEKR